MEYCMNQLQTPIHLPIPQLTTNKASVVITFANCFLLLVEINRLVTASTDNHSCWWCFHGAKWILNEQTISQSVLDEEWWTINLNSPLTRTWCSHSHANHGCGKPQQCLPTISNTLFPVLRGHEERGKECSLYRYTKSLIWRGWRGCIREHVYTTVLSGYRCEMDTLTLLTDNRCQVNTLTLNQPGSEDYDSLYQLDA